MDITQKNLNLGCGELNFSDSFRIDLREAAHPDLIRDLNDMPWPLPDSHFENVYAYDIIEHLRDVIAVIRECWRVLKPGGCLHIHTSHYKYENAYVDPTHIHFFALDSFDFFDPETFWGKKYSWYSPDRHFHIEEKRPDGQEILIRMRKI